MERGISGRVNHFEKAKSIDVNVEEIEDGGVKEKLSALANASPDKYKALDDRLNKIGLPISAFNAFDAVSDGVYDMLDRYYDSDDAEDLDNLVNLLDS